MPLGTLRKSAAWLSVTVALIALMTPGKAAGSTPFKIGISAPVVTIFPVWMADAGGFYEKEGLKVEVVNMEGGTRGLQVLLSSEIQAMHVGLAPVVLASCLPGKAWSAAGGRASWSRWQDLGGTPTTMSMKPPRITRSLMR